MKAIAPLPRDPRTPREWQDAVDAAQFCLEIESCRMYGLIEGGPEFNVERCVAILERGARKGIFPRKDEKKA